MTVSIKFPNSKTIKITFKQTVSAKKAQDQGLRLFQMNIPHYNIKQEIFYNIKTCFKCYKIETHFTNQCTKPKELTICSGYSEGYTWKDCKTSSLRQISFHSSDATLEYSIYDCRPQYQAHYTMTQLSKQTRQTNTQIHTK